MLQFISNRVNFLKFITNSEVETHDLGINISRYFKRGQIVCLNGEMGTGKTAFVKGILKGLNYAGVVTSPTFAICHQYFADINVYHLDLYRINGYEDLYSIGFFDIEDKDSVIFIEWAENASEYLNDSFNINFSYGKEENERIIDIDDNLYK